MAEQPRNGHDPTRLDRIEGLLEVLVNEHVQFAQEHRNFAQEHRQLLTAQVVLTDRVEKLAKTVDRMASAQEESKRDFDERLNALIAVVDGIVRKNPPQ